jgi:hypothetical protein
MANPWFKFYGGEYLSDPKILSLSPCERSCWLTLLCFAGLSNGTIKYVTEERLMIQAGLDTASDEWDRTVGVINKFVKLEMIELDNGFIVIKNWKKRQESNLTGYERVKRYREKQNTVINDNVMITSELEVDKEEDTTSKKSNSFKTTDKQKFTEQEWIKVLRSWKLSGNRVIDNKRLVIRKDKSLWLIDMLGTWTPYTIKLNKQ